MEKLYISVLIHLNLILPITKQAVLTMRNLDLNTIEYYLYTGYKEEGEYLNYFQISYRQNRECYYPLLANDIAYFKKYVFVAHQMHTCLFYTPDYLYLGFLTNFNDDKLYYRIHSVYEARDTYDDLFIEVESYINTVLSIRSSKDIYRNPHYTTPNSNGFLTDSTPDSECIDTIDVLYMNENNNIMALYKNPIYIYGKHIFPWKNGTFDSASVDYWTINHLEQAGIVTSNGLIQYYKYSDFYDMIYTNSKSHYEKDFIRCYINYLKGLSPEKRSSTPLLIPEFRFGERSIKHKYRLDFLIINLRTQKKIGIELSPDSSHCVDSRLSPNEFYKTKDFLKTYDISIYTFLQNDLNDIQGCFNDIRKYLI